MAIADLDLNDLAFPPPPEPMVAISSFTLPPNFPEATLFGMLLVKFGEPNGFMSSVLPEGGDPDAPFKWDFYAGSPAGDVFSIQRTWLGIEVLVFTGDVDKNDFLRFFGRNADRYAKAIQDRLDGLEQYVVLANPVARHRDIAAIATVELQRIEVPAIYYPVSLGRPVGRREQKRHLDSLERCRWALDLQAMFANIAVTSSAFFAEGAINLVVALLAKPDLRRDTVLYEQFLRERWSQKLVKLRFYCDEVAGDHDPKDPAVVELQRLFDLRNRVAHAYPDPEVLKVERMWFLGNTPVLPRAEPYDRHQLGMATVLPRRDEALKALEVADTFVRYLVAMLTPAGASAVSMFGPANPIGWNATTRRFSLPFGRQVVKVFFGGQRPRGRRKSKVTPR